MLKDLNKNNLFNKLYKKPFSAHIKGSYTTDKVDISTNTVDKKCLLKKAVDLFAFNDVEYEGEDIKLWSSNIGILSKRDFDTLLANYTGDDLTYIRDQYKCGHFSIDFVDYMTEVTKHNKLKANLAVGLFAYYYIKNERKGGHVVCWVGINTFSNTDVCDSLRLKIVEPQTGQSWWFSDYIDYLREKKDYDDIELELFFMN